MNIKENLFTPILKVCASALPFGVLKKLTGQEVIFPTYHLVSNQEVPHVGNLYQIRSEKLFHEDLEFMLKHFNPISIDELLKWRNGQLRLNKPSFFLSFDDGLREVNEVIAPILIKKGIPAAFFINPAFVDNKELMFRNKASLLIDRFKKRKINFKRTIDTTGVNEDQFIQIVKSVKYRERDILDKLALASEFSFSDYLNEKKPYLESEKILQLKLQGFHIGAHSVDHPLYEQITLQEQVVQTSESVDFIISKNFSKLRTFAFPFTDHGVSKTLFNQMYENMRLDCSFGVAGIKHENFKFHFQRIPMEKSLDSARKIIAAEYIYYILKTPLGKNHINRK
ncbi:MAG: polysaccharide deacetylase family protein [Sporocytophaga sp.]|uniref:polysaccharide deacetylase family protein n=1 Tax=Sporocytophaga sp. TaxID=2231183 RepID=UPI001B0CF696|nr:polysaccharide deacetylase family protein [Sporocytophaga sp.]MBO9701691.1 polysaccharide deacetylase family protein [Sporocytophaga sp.]